MISLAAGLALPLLAPFYSWGAALGLVLSTWVVLSTLQWLLERATGGRPLLQALMNTPRGGWGMVFGHVGVAVFIVGITLTSIYSTEKDVRLEPNTNYPMSGYDFYFKGVARSNGPNYYADRGVVEISRDGQLVAILEPEKRIYLASRMPMTEAGIDAGITRDLFVALGEPLGDDGAWAVRLYHKPFIRWIWLGGILMAFGGLLAASDRRYFRLARKAKLSAAERAAAEAAT